MSPTLKLLISFILLILLGYCGFYTGFPPHGTPEQAEAKLQKAANAALDGADLSWASVELDGQLARLGGTAPNAEAMDRARDIVRHAEWAGGLVLGGVTVVRDDIRLAEMKEPELPVARPFTWGAAFEGAGPVTLTGYVPSEAVRARLLAEAERLYPGGVIDRMQVARGADETSWEQAAMRKLSALSALDRGSITATDERFVLRGFASGPEAEAQARDAIGGFIDGYSSTLTIDLPEPEPVPAPDPDIVVREATPEAADSCQEDFDSIMRDNVINFATSSDRIAASSYPLLDRLASLAKECQAFRIEVAGHTDSTGGNQMNMDLSNARAQSVVNYLANQGVDIRQLRARGFGETAPIASNATREGRARNRRIEFTVQQN